MPNDMNRDDLLRLTPRIYLREGYRDGAGKLLPRLRGLYATAAAAQFEHAEVSPQELAGTLEALRQVLPWHKGEAQDLLRDAVSEALELAAGLRAPHQRANALAAVAPVLPLADWQLDSPAALANWLNSGGGAFLGQHAGGTVIAQLSVRAHGGPPQWTVAGYAPDTDETFAVTVDATDGATAIAATP